MPRCVRRSWRAVIVGSPDRSATTVAINPRTPAVIYGTVSGGGALKSTDGGETWNRLDTGQNVPVGVAKLVVDPQTPTTVYAGQGPSNTRTYGLFKTTDSGNTWRAINNGLLVYVGLSIWGLALDPQVPTTLYTTLANVAPNLYKTTDGGAAWIAVNNGIGKNKSGGVLAVDPQSSTVYAGAYEPFVGYSVLRSTDGGASWSSVPMASQVFVLLSTLRPPPSSMLALALASSRAATAVRVGAPPS